MIYAIFAVSMLTIIIGFIALQTRISSVKNRHLKVGYFQLMQGEDVPENVIKTTRCLNNMFEVPVLFYVVAMLYIVLDVESLLALILAWSFFISRCIHAYIHMGYNVVKHRMYAFMMSVICVIALWFNLLILLT